MEQTFVNKVLIVEDDVAMREIMAKELKHINVEVLQATDGEIALKMCTEYKPKVIILDLMLPKVDGFAVLELIRKNPDAAISGIPVVVLSNLWSDKDILRTQALKIDAYYVKANTFLGEVAQKVEEILKQKQVA